MQWFTDVVSSLVKSNKRIGKYQKRGGGFSEKSVLIKMGQTYYQTTIKRFIDKEAFFNESI
jgi:hypothetical protein